MNDIYDVGAVLILLIIIGLIRLASASMLAYYDSERIKKVRKRETQRWDDIVRDVKKQLKEM